MASLSYLTLLILDNTDHDNKSLFFLCYSSYQRLNQIILNWEHWEQFRYTMS